MTGDRSKRIRSAVQRITGDNGSEKIISVDALFDIANRIQRRIAEETLNIEDTVTISTIPGQEFYAFPDGMINERKLIPAGSTEMVLINKDRVDRLKRALSLQDSTDSTAGDLFFYHKWAGQFGFLLSNGSVPGSSIEVSVYFWRYPDDIVEKISNTVDPVVESRWDTTFIYGVVAEILLTAQWEEKYEREFARQKAREITSLAENMEILPSGDYE